MSPPEQDSVRPVTGISGLLCVYTGTSAGGWTWQAGRAEADGVGDRCLLTVTITVLSLSSQTCAPKLPHHFTPSLPFG